MLNTDMLQLRTNYLRQLHPFAREMMKSMNAVTISILAKVCLCVSPCKISLHSGRAVMSKLDVNSNLIDSNLERVRHAFFLIKVKCLFEQTQFTGACGLI